MIVPVVTVAETADIMTCDIVVCTVPLHRDVFRGGHGGNAPPPAIGYK